jgi:glycosyltransferase involved in cell wall biosynthesis
MGGARGGSGRSDAVLDVHSATMRIACLCEGAPHPRRGASRVLYHLYVRGLLDAGHSVRLVLLPQTAEEARAEAPDAVALGFPEGASLEVTRLRSFPCFRHALTGARVDTRAEAEALHELETFTPDLLLCFDVLAAGLARRVRCPRVAWLGDLQFETLWWHTRFAMKEGSRRYDRLLLLPLRVAQLRRFYCEALTGAHVVVSSKSSESKLADLGIQSTYLPYPWPRLTGARSARTVLARPTFLFSGTLGALGSRSAFHLLFSEIHPRMRAVFGDGGFAIRITGAGELPSWVAEALAARSEISFLGFVEDLAGMMDECTAFIAPIDVPVGNRSRLLTCMAAGLPIVTDPATALGNPLLIDGVTCLLKRDADAFVAGAALLHRDHALAMRLSEAARGAYEAHHSPEAANSALIRYLSAAVGGV